VSKETEIAGLDMPEMGALGYPEFHMREATTVSGVTDKAAE
jgi:hypothetical protein